MLKLVAAYYEEFKLRLNTTLQLWKIKAGNGNYVFGTITIIEPGNLTIGDCCRFNHGTYLNATNCIKLGNDVTLSQGCSLITTGIDYRAWAKGKRSHGGGEIVINSHVWIGAKAIILPGVKITGQYVVVAAGAVVTHDITENYCIVAGIPAKIIKYII